jgi:hypothetical protein
MGLFPLPVAIRQGRDLKCRVYQAASRLFFDPRKSFVATCLSMAFPCTHASASALLLTDLAESCASVQIFR